MGAILGLIMKTLFTEKMIKKLVITLSEYLVKSTKNSLDDKIFNMMKGKLQ